MNLTNIDTIKNLFRQRNIQPRYQQGQNFLIDKIVLDKLLETANLKSSDTVLEVGAGFGVITQELAKRVNRVIAVEFDNNLIPILRQNTHNSKNLTIINDDILKLNLFDIQFPTSGFRIIANLPYNITSRFIRNALSQQPKPKDMVLIIQREVADRICAKPGGDMSLLSLSVQFYAKPEIISYIGQESFWPAPKVESAIIKINNIKNRTDVDEKDFFKIAKIGFSARRKMLKNNLVAGLKIGLPPIAELVSRSNSEGRAKGGDGEIQKIMESVGLSKTARAQDLGVEDWIRLANILPQKRLPRLTARFDSARRAVKAGKEPPSS